MSSAPIKEALSFLLVAALWGCTNPFLGRGMFGSILALDRSLPRLIFSITLGGASCTLRTAATKSGSAQSSDAAASPPPSVAAQLLHLFLNWQFWVPYGINQAGSLLYNYLLGSTDLSLASPICNSLTFVFTGITARALGEPQPFNWSFILGALLIVAGVTLCVAAKLDITASAGI